MFKHVKAFSSFSVDDLEKAEEFYGKTLGLKLSKNEMGILQLHVEGSNDVIIYPKDDHVPATFTILNFPVDDIESTVDELIGRGVAFEHYEWVDDKKGIMRIENTPPIAWFTDPAGNILSVIEMSEQTQPA